MSFASVLDLETGAAGAVIAQDAVLPCGLHALIRWGCGKSEHIFTDESNCNSVRRYVLEASQAGLSAPFFRTPQPHIRAALELAGIGADDIVCDLGCGDGQVLLEAAALGARGIGIDLSKVMLESCKRQAEEAGLSKQLKFHCAEFGEAMRTADGPARHATVIFIYNLPPGLKRLQSVLLPRLTKQRGGGGGSLRAIVTYRHHFSDDVKPVGETCFGLLRLYACTDTG